MDTKAVNRFWARYNDPEVRAMLKLRAGLQAAGYPADAMTDDEVVIAAMERSGESFCAAIASLGESLRAATEAAELLGIAADEAQAAIDSIDPAR